MKTVAFIFTSTALLLLSACAPAKDGTVSFSESTDQNKTTSEGNTKFDRAMQAANVGYRSGDYAAVEAAYNTAIKESESLDAKDPRRALAVHKLATAYQEQGKYKEAQPLFEKALKIDREIHREPHLDIARDLVFLAINKQTLADFAAAEPIWKEAVEIRDKLSPCVSEAATDHAEYARNLLKQKKAAQAQSQALKAVEINEKLHGKEHLSVARDLTLLAQIYQAQRKSTDEEACYKRALAINEKYLSARDPESAQLKQKYAAYLRAQKREDEAKKIEASIGAKAKSRATPSESPAIPTTPPPENKSAH